MKKYKKALIILLLIIIVVTALLTYSKLCYSRKEILSIINRNSEKLDNIYIKIETDYEERDEEHIEEIYSKDNIIYTNSYTTYVLSDDILDTSIEIWNLETKKKYLLNHIDKTIYTSTIRGKRTS